MSNRKFVTAAAFTSAALLVLILVPHGLHTSHPQLTGVELVAFGVLVGGYGTMVGAGGGVLIVPALLISFHTTPEQAVGTSITVVFLNAVSGTASYARQHRIDYKAGLAFALASVPGAILGAFLTSFLSGRGFDIGFAALLIALALFLMWRPVAETEYADSLIDAADADRWLVQRQHTDAYGATFHYQYDLRRGLAVSALVGVMSSVLGIGGGIIHVPVLIHLLGFPAHIATATSHFILVITAAVGAGTHLALGHVLMGPAILMGVGVIGGAQMGASIGKKLKGSLLIRMLAVALLLVAARLLFR